MELYLYYIILMDFKINLYKKKYIYIYMRRDSIRINDEYKNIYIIF